VTQAQERRFDHESGSSQLCRPEKSRPHPVSLPGAARSLRTQQRVKHLPHRRTRSTTHPPPHRSGRTLGPVLGYRTTSSAPTNRCSTLEHLPRSVRPWPGSAPPVPGTVVSAP